MTKRMRPIVSTVLLVSIVAILVAACDIFNSSKSSGGGGTPAPILIEGQWSRRASQHHFTSSLMTHRYINFGDGVINTVENEIVYYDNDKAEFVIRRSEGAGGGYGKLS